MSKAERILKSKVNRNTYYLFSDKIIIKGEKEGEILLPGDYDVICFCDIYYESKELHVFLATTGYYDRTYVLDEYDLTMQHIGYRK